jgi:trehalose 6-phosphate phosphatase
MTTDRGWAQATKAPPAGPRRRAKESASASPLPAFLPYMDGRNGNGGMMAEEPRPLAELDLSLLAPGRTAFFLDFDGTLADFNEDPAAVFLPGRERRSLAALATVASGAVAIVSGRAIADIDRMFAPLKLPAAGVHGLERRKASGEVSRAALSEAPLAFARSRLQALARLHPGLLVEEKPGSVALHFRRRPELEPQCLEIARNISEAEETLQVLHGKMVIELKVGGATKADAIAAFMREAPFEGRRPFFAGDDSTDEDAFGKVLGLKGISVKVGPGVTIAAYRAAGIDAFRDWLAGLAQRFNETEGSTAARA